MPRDLGDVLDYLLPSASTTAESPRVARPRTKRPPQRPRIRAANSGALPIVSLPIGGHDFIRAAFVWNLAVEVARLGAHATLLAPANPDAALLWPTPGRGPLGADLSLVEAGNLRDLNRAALDLAVSRAGESTDGGIILVRIPPEWIDCTAEADCLLRWVLLFTSPEARDLREAYAVMKRITQSGLSTRVGVTIHGARRIGEAKNAFTRLSNTALRHLQHSVVSYGLLMDDIHIYRAIVARRPIGLEHPQSRAARALRDVAGLLLDDARKYSVG